MIVELSDDAITIIGDCVKQCDAEGYPFMSFMGKRFCAAMDEIIDKLKVKTKYLDYCRTDPTEYYSAVKTS